MVNILMYVFISKFNFGVFDYLSEESTKDIDLLLSRGFKLYHSCKETAINKKIWKLIGKIDLEAKSISVSDLAIFLSWNKEYSFQESKIMSNRFGIFMWPTGFTEPTSLRLHCCMW